MHLSKQKDVPYEEMQYCLIRKLGYDGWKRVKDAGRRWIVEIVFSQSKEY